MEVVAALSQGRTAVAQCGLFTHKSVPVIFEPPCVCVCVYIYIYIYIYIYGLKFVICFLRLMFEGAFAKLRKTAISCVMSVCPSVHVEQLGLHWTDFHEILYLSILIKSVLNVEISLKSDKNDGHFTWRPLYIFDHISFS